MLSEAKHLWSIPLSGIGKKLIRDSSLSLRMTIWSAC
jgi:hypothetical protein